MARLSPAQRTRLVMLHFAGSSFASIARQEGCNVKTVSKWVSRYNTTGSFESRKGPGPAVSMDIAARKRALELLESSEAGGLRYVARKLREEKLTPRVLSRTTVSRGARAQAAEEGDGLLCLRGRPRKALTAKTKAARVSFARANRNREWRNVMITDRCKFAHRYPGSRVQRCRWVRASKRAQDACFKPNRPSVLNVYAGITRHGVTGIVKVTGTTKFKSTYFNQKGAAARNITKAEYKDVSDSLLEDGDKIFGRAGIHRWVLQQDNDPTHGAAKQAIIEHNNSSRSKVELLSGWPPHSPDLSPIENVWGWVDAKVAAMGCNTFDEFEAAVISTLESIPGDMLENRFDSIPKRLKAVEENGGEKCGY